MKSLYLYQNATRQRFAKACAMLLLGTAAALLTLAPPAHAQQTLARGVTISDIGAVKQTDTSVTTLKATAVNNSGKPIALLTVRFELYDAANNIVGEASASQANLASGETWNIAVDTPTPFARFTMMNVDAQ